MKKNGKMKRVISLIAILCMILQSFSVVNAAAADITLAAVNMANGVALSWSASDFGGAKEYTLYRDGVPLATVDDENTNASLDSGTWTYNDVYFTTLEQMLGELSGKDSADLSTNHTYYVKAGDSVSSSVTGKPDSSKLAYFTFTNVENTTDWGNWNNINTGSNGIVYNKFNSSSMATQSETASALQTTGDYAQYTSKYSIESLTTKTHRGFSFVGKMDGKMAGGLVAAKTGDTTVPYASYMQFKIADTNAYFYSDTENRDYMAWINASIVDNQMITNDSFGGFTSNGEVIPDSSTATVTYKYGINNPSFCFDLDDSLTGAERYATYKFTVNRQFNSSNKNFAFYAASSSDSSKGIGGNALYYDADGEHAAIHSIALMRSADYLGGDVEDVLKENLPDLTATVKANGVVLTWKGREFDNAGEYDLYRDSEKIATVNGSSVGEYDSEMGTYSYSDVYFNTLEEMLSENGKAPAVAVNTDHTYYVKANETTSEAVTATADTSKVKYFTFNATTQPTDWNNINGTGSNSGIGYNKNASNITAGESSVAMGSSEDYSSYNTKYTTSATNASYIGSMYGKMSGGLVYASNNGTAPIASLLQFRVTDETLTYDTTAQDYTVLVNGLFNHDSGYTLRKFAGLYGKFKDDGSNKGYVIPDKEDAEIVFWPSASGGFTVQYDADLAMENRYATYVFTTKREFSTNKYLNFNAPDVSASNAAKMNANGENAAIHSIAVMRSADYLDVPVTVPAVEKYEINGVKVTGTDGITDTQLVSGKKITAVSVRKYTEASSAVTVILALYNNGQLADAVVETVTPSLNQYAYGDIALSKGLSLPAAVTDSHTVKVFILDDTKTLIPAAKSFTVLPRNTTTYPQAG